MANYTGLTHIAFEVEDVSQTFDLAMRHGGQVPGEVIERKIEGMRNLKFVYFRDPEGNIIEIQSW